MFEVTFNSILIDQEKVLCKLAKYHQQEERTVESTSSAITTLTEELQYHKDNLLQAKKLSKSLQAAL